MTATIKEPPSEAMNRRCFHPEYPAARLALTLDAESVYVRLADETGNVLGLFEMDRQDRTSGWTLFLRLRPGTYRYRYFAYDGRITTLVRASDVEDVVPHMDGFDAVFQLDAHHASDANPLSSCLERSVQ